MSDHGDEPAGHLRRTRTVCDEQVILHDRAYDVVRVKLSVRDGSERIRGIVRHRGAVIVLPILDDGRVVLIRNERWVVGRALIELPAGGLEPGETPQAAAVRECAEETGFRPNSVERLGCFYTCPGFSDELMHAFVARGLVAQSQQLEPDESIQVCPVSGNEAMAMADRGEITDAKTLATLLLAARRGVL